MTNELTDAAFKIYKEVLKGIAEECVTPRELHHMAQMMEDCGPPRYAAKLRKLANVMERMIK